MIRVPSSIYSYNTLTHYNTESLNKLAVQCAHVKVTQGSDYAIHPSCPTVVARPSPVIINVSSLNLSFFKCQLICNFWLYLVSQKKKSAAIINKRSLCGFKKRLSVIETRKTLTQYFHNISFEFRDYISTGIWWHITTLKERSPKLKIRIKYTFAYYYLQNLK